MLFESFSKFQYRFCEQNLILISGFSLFFIEIIVFAVREPMGNASSTLTQYDIEEVQEHSNHLCGSSLHMDFLFCFVHFSRIWLGSDFWFFVVFGVKISFPARNSVVVQEILPT